MKQIQSEKARIRPVSVVMKQKADRTENECEAAMWPYGKPALAVYTLASIDVAHS